MTVLLSVPQVDRSRYLARVLRQSPGKLKPEYLDDGVDFTMPGRTKDGPVARVRFTNPDQVISGCWLEVEDRNTVRSDNLLPLVNQILDSSLNSTKTLSGVDVQTSEDSGKIEADRIQFLLSERTTQTHAVNLVPRLLDRVSSMDNSIYIGAMALKRRSPKWGYARVRININTGDVDIVIYHYAPQGVKALVQSFYQRMYKSGFGAQTAAQKVHRVIKAMSFIVADDSPKLAYAAMGGDSSLISGGGVINLMDKRAVDDLDRVLSQQTTIGEPLLLFPDGSNGPLVRIDGEFLYTVPSGGPMPGRDGTYYFMSLDKSTNDLHRFRGTYAVNRPDNYRRLEHFTNWLADHDDVSALKMLLSHMPVAKAKKG